MTNRKNKRARSPSPVWDDPYDADEDRDEVAKSKRTRRAEYLTLEKVGKYQQLNSINQPSAIDPMRTNEAGSAAPLFPKAPAPAAPPAAKKAPSTSGQGGDPWYAAPDEVDYDDSEDDLWFEEEEARKKKEMEMKKGGGEEEAPASNPHAAAAAPSPSGPSLSDPSAHPAAEAQGATQPHDSDADSDDSKGRKRFHVPDPESEEPSNGDSQDEDGDGDKEKEALKTEKGEEEKKDDEEAPASDSVVAPATPSAPPPVPVAPAAIAAAAPVAPSLPGSNAAASSTTGTKRKCDDSDPADAPMAKAQKRSHERDGEGEESADEGEDAGDKAGSAVAAPAPPAPIPTSTASNLSPPQPPVSTAPEVHLARDQEVEMGEAIDQAIDQAIEIGDAPAGPLSVRTAPGPLIQGDDTMQGVEATGPESAAVEKSVDDSEAAQTPVCSAATGAGISTGTVSRAQDAKPLADAPGVGKKDGAAAGSDGAVACQSEQCAPPPSTPSAEIAGDGKERCLTDADGAEACESERCEASSSVTDVLGDGINATETAGASQEACQEEKCADAEGDKPTTPSLEGSGVEAPTPDVPDVRTEQGGEETMDAAGALREAFEAVPGLDAVVDGAAADQIPTGSDWASVCQSEQCAEAIMAGPDSVAATTGVDAIETSQALGEACVEEIGGDSVAATPDALDVMKERDGTDDATQTTKASGEAFAVGCGITSGAMVDNATTPASAGCEVKSGDGGSATEATTTHPVPDIVTELGGSDAIAASQALGEACSEEQCIDAVVESVAAPGSKRPFNKYAALAEYQLEARRRVRRALWNGWTRPALPDVTTTEDQGSKVKGVGEGETVICTYEDFGFVEDPEAEVVAEDEEEEAEEAVKGWAGLVGMPLWRWLLLFFLALWVLGMAFCQKEPEPRSSLATMADFLTPVDTVAGRCRQLPEALQFLRDEEQWMGVGSVTLVEKNRSVTWDVTDLCGSGGGVRGGGWG
ncbi:hypothetical protein FN846DRAFT_1013324 [Sphaerosporella brunnea]|uniref:Uncharacterized protein n=1 Tax=Sphaerosporella brunnea TaxID=1250544 RepID=A0A5J5EXN7_9PEZI|nr:hypothetical protein FN846DRAFT_1013324 [Sphaerosporella brunnea]